MNNKMRCLVYSILLLILFPSVFANITDHVVISEVLYNPVNESGSEFVELYNPTDADINITGWYINTSASGTDATIPLEIIHAYGFYLIADTGWSTGKDNSSWQNADHEEKITLSNTGDRVQLMNSSGSVIDILGWGDSVVNETIAYPTVSQSESIERKSSFVHYIQRIPWALAQVVVSLYPLPP